MPTASSITRISVFILVFICSQFVLVPWSEAATVAHYRFEDSPGFTNDSSSFADLDNTSVVQYTLPSTGQGSTFGVPQGAGSNAKAADLDASGDLFDTFNTGTDLFTGNTLTIEAYFSFESGDTFSAIVAQWDFGSGNRVFQLLINGNTLRMAVSPNGAANETLDSGFIVEPNTDYFAAVTFDSGNVTFYLTPNPNNPGPTMISTATSIYSSLHEHDRLTIGGAVGGSGQNHFIGVIDEVRISDTVVASNDFLYPPETGLPATAVHWRFEDSPGFTNDSSTSGMILKNNTSTTQYTLPGSGVGSDFPSPVPQTGDANAKAAEFNSTADVLDTVQSGIWPIIDDYTLEAFINNDAAVGSRNVIVSAWDHSAGHRSFQFAVNSSDKLEALLGTGTGFSAVTSTLTITQDKDYFVAMSFDEDGDVTFYAQNLTDGGTLQSNTQSHALSSYFRDDHFAVGNTIGGGANQLDGVIDEVRISRGILQVSELLIASSGAGPDAGTVVIFK